LEVVKVNQFPELLKRFFGVVIRGDTYLNLIYLFLAFPLGLFYFIFLVVGFALGFGLLIIWVGLLILLFVFGGWWLFATFERQMAIGLLHEDIPPMKPPVNADEELVKKSLWDQLVAYLTNPVTWTGLLYLFFKFPLGILSFVVSVTLLAFSAVFLTAPLTFWFVQPEIWFTYNLVWRIDTFGESLLAFLIGIPLLFISLHILNGLAWLSGRFARIMLGSARAYPAWSSIVSEPTLDSSEKVEELDMGEKANSEASPTSNDDLSPPEKAQAPPPEESKPLSDETSEEE
jgi:hypothetical protein